MKISDVLWKAANEHLCTDGADGEKQTYVCHAIGMTLGHGYLGTAESEREPATRFLAELGMPLDGGGFDRWRSPCGPRQLSAEVQQQVRYAWLVFASDYAAELEARGEL
jgi:hypothetical protein